MSKPRGPKRQLIMTFHNKDTGQRHGPGVIVTGSAKPISQVHEATLRNIQKIQPQFKNITPRLSESNVGTTIGFHGIKQSEWNNIFKKKKEN